MNYEQREMIQHWENLAAKQMIQPIDRDILSDWASDQGVDCAGVVGARWVQSRGSNPLRNHLERHLPWGLVPPQMYSNGDLSAIDAYFDILQRCKDQL